MTAVVADRPLTPDPPRVPGVPPQLPPRPAHAYCPTCMGVLPGWLAGCTKPACRRADHNYDAAIDARCGQ
ncbi:hypothetical protein [Micromonospora sediminicola]|uniref:hypothetical protein n=1 Tax=Micromonospora sediminicola TaxID=946078 RepID=UPI0037B0465B